MTLGDKVYQKMFSMKEAEEFELSKVRPENKNEFIDIIKTFINQDNGRHLNFYLEFSNSYQRVRKMRYN